MIETPCDNTARTLSLTQLVCVVTRSHRGEYFARYRCADICIDVVSCHRGGCLYCGSITIKTPTTTKTIDSTSSIARYAEPGDTDNSTTRYLMSLVK